MSGAQERSSANAGRRRQVLEWLAQLNQAWREGRAEEVAAYLHAGVVHVAPGFDRRLQRREACAR